MRCERGHTFDAARHGYVSMLRSEARVDTADSAAMVEARAAFLGAGHYSFLADAVAGATDRGPGGGVVVEAGAGTGYYLARALDRHPERAGLALDVSKHALRRAARVHPRVAAVACDVWGTFPLRDASAAIVLSVFAPRNPKEMRRVLASDGLLVVVTPTRRHLEELSAPLGLLEVEERKHERLAESLDPLFAVDERVECESSMRLGHDDVLALGAMGPTARHSTPEELASAAARLEYPVLVTASATVTSYRRRAGRA